MNGGVGFRVRVMRRFGTIILGRDLTFFSVVFPLLLQGASSPKIHTQKMPIGAVGGSVVDPYDTYKNAQKKTKKQR